MQEKRQMHGVLHVQARLVEAFEQKEAIRKMEEQLTIYEYLAPAFKIDKPVRLIELFAGIGSQAKALENLGVRFEHWKAIEFDKYAIDAYNAVHETQFKTSDIRNIHASDLELTDRDKFCYMLTYSFPCQDLSQANNKRKGMKKGSGSRSGLLWEVERILDECNGELPQVLLMENVPQVISKVNISDFQLWRDKLERLGYSNYLKILNAKDYGIPQTRARCFMVSILGDFAYTFPERRQTPIKLANLLETEVNQKYFFTGAKVRKANIKRITNGLMVPEKTKKGYKLARAGDGVYIDRPHQKCGTVQRKMIPTLKTHCSDVGVIVSDTSDKLKIRKLTPLEFWRLMGFSDEDFYKAQKVCSEAQLYKQAGNSIVVNVLEAIFSQMY